MLGSFWRLNTLISSNTSFRVCVWVRVGVYVRACVCTPSLFTAGGCVCSVGLWSILLMDELYYPCTTVTPLRQRNRNFSHFSPSAGECTGTLLTGKHVHPQLECMEEQLWARTALKWNGDALFLQSLQWPCIQCENKCGSFRFDHFNQDHHHHLLLLLVLLLEVEFHSGCHPDRVWAQ